MSVLGRGVRNAFRNGIRTFAIVVILGLSIAMALAMVLARQAVTGRIESVEGSIGNIITIAPAGFRGFQGGGEPLTTDKLDAVAKVAHVVGLTMSLQDRLAGDDTSLQSSLELGSLGRRFAGQAGGGAAGAGGQVPPGGFQLPAGGGLGQRGGQGGDPVLPVIVVGTTDPTTLAAAGSGRVSLTSGTAFGAASTDNVALLGESLATKNNLAVGGTFTVRGTTLTVAGVFSTGNTFGDSVAILPLATLQRLSDQPGAVTSATVQVDAIGNLATTQDAIRSTLGTSADVVSPQDTSAQALEPLANIRSISSYSLTGAVVAGAVIIFLTMLMIVRERRREIAVLKAIGAPNRKVVGQFVFEAVTFTSMAAVLGVLGGVIAANPITRLLVNTSDTSTQAAGPFGGPGGGAGGGLRQAGGAVARLAGQAQQQAGAFNLDTLRASVGVDVLLYGLAAALVITVIGSMIPSWLISRVRPAEVLRGD